MEQNTMVYYDKSWKSGIPASKKLYSRLLTHQLSRKLNHKNYEVLFEAPLDPVHENKFEPDVVIYSCENSLKPIVAIEFCTSENYLDNFIYISNLFSQFKLEEFFFYDEKDNHWLRMTSNESNPTATSWSSTLNVRLSEELKKAL